LQINLFNNTKNLSGHAGDKFIGIQNPGCAGNVKNLLL